jgi:hypothetical protein
VAYVSATQKLGVWPFTGSTAADVAGRALEVLEFINTLHRQIHGLDAHYQPVPGYVPPAGVTPEFLAAWDGFYRISQNYLVVAIQHPLALTSSSVRTRIEAFGAQALEWREAYTRAGGTPVGPAIHPETPPEPMADFMTQLKQVLWAVAGVGAVGLVAYGIVKYRPWERFAKTHRAVGRRLEFVGQGW